MTHPIILWGGTGQARVLHEFLSARGYRLVALFDNNPAVESPFPHVPMYHGWAVFEAWRRDFSGYVAGAVAIGGARGADRVQIAQRLAAAGVEIVALVHPRAFVAGDARVGNGCQLMAQSTVASGAVLGAGCLINHGAIVEHECVLGDGVHIGPGATLCGVVEVGANTFVGAGAVVLPRLRLGSGSVVGAGSVVTRNLPDNVVAFGNPARIIRPLATRDTPAPGAPADPRGSHP